MGGGAAVGAGAMSAQRLMSSPSSASLGDDAFFAFSIVLGLVLFWFVVAALIAEVRR